MRRTPTFMYLSSVLALFALGLSACQSQAPAKQEDGAAAVAPLTKADAAPKQGEAGGAAAPAPAARVYDAVPKLDPAQEEALKGHIGQSCVVDLSCPQYLRCVDAKCAMPAAMTEQPVSPQTPKVSFWSADGDKSLATFYVELATDDDQRSRGLMFRRQMHDDWGMLFIYPEDGPRSFWMRNTYMPLDMVFINSQGLVMGVVEDAEPMTLDPRRVEGMSRYVLELKSGWAAKHGIAKGARVSMTNLREEYLPVP